LKTNNNHITPFLTKAKKYQLLKWTVLLVILTGFWFCLPNPLFRSPTSFVITDEQQNLLGATIATDGQWRFPYGEAVPGKFAQCIIAFEDKRFYHHPGVDPIALGRAIYQNIRGKKVISGGSTLTMQVLRLSRQKRRNIFQKMAEAVQAVRLECGYNKKEILALYAANAPFGSNVVGLQAAAWRYFGRNAQQLSWAETAMLAVLPNAPSLVHPGKNRQLLLAKRNGLLQKLSQQKIIDQTTATLAQLEPLPLQPIPLPMWAPHLLNRFKRDYAAAKNNGQPTITTTTIQLLLQQSVTRLLDRYHQSFKGNGINNAAAMVMEVETGNVLAYVGNVYHPADPELQSHVDILSSPRSPGSTLKPLLFAAMQTDGQILPRQLVADVPTRIGGYQPQNFAMSYDGAVPANNALSRSLNVPAVKMLQQYKYPRFYNVLKQCGFTTLTQPANHYGLSLILGGCEVTPWELSGVYASLARSYLHQSQNKGKMNGGDWMMPGYVKREVVSSELAVVSGDVKRERSKVNGEEVSGEEVSSELSVMSREVVNGELSMVNGERVGVKRERSKVNGEDVSSELSVVSRDVKRELLKVNGEEVSSEDVSSELSVVSEERFRVISEWAMGNGVAKIGEPKRSALKGERFRNTAPPIGFDFTSLWQTFNAMQEVMRPGEEGLWNLFSSAQKVAWKTGTSVGFRDGWAIGLTPKYCVVVWVGNADGEGRPELTGINTAAPILFDIFRMLPTSPWFQAPAYDYTYLPVCHQSGFKASPGCTLVDTLLVSINGKAAPPCPYHKLVHLDASGQYQATANCVSPSAMQHQNWFVLPPAMEYYYKPSHPDYKSLPPFLPGCATSEGRQMDFIYPDDRAKIFIPVELSGQPGQTIFTAVHHNANAQLFWHLNDQYIGTTTRFHQIALRPPPGTHTITIVDDGGETITRRFTITTKQ